ncbi:MAG: hypothetical protein GQ557_01635, partial [Mycoplasmataceae bacterium]|nr:hypothetical protein [Mycoplasmataceae bacterium]
ICQFSQVNTSVNDNNIEPINNASAYISGIRSVTKTADYNKTIGKSCEGIDDTATVTSTLRTLKKVINLTEFIGIFTENSYIPLQYAKVKINFVLNNLAQIANFDTTGAPAYTLTMKITGNIISFDQDIDDIYKQLWEADKLALNLSGKNVYSFTIPSGTSHITHNITTPYKMGTAIYSGMVLSSSQNSDTSDAYSFIPGATAYLIDTVCNVLGQNHPASPIETHASGAQANQNLLVALGLKGGLLSISNYSTEGAYNWLTSTSKRSLIGISLDPNPYDSIISGIDCRQMSLTKNFTSGIAVAMTDFVCITYLGKVKLGRQINTQLIT